MDWLVSTFDALTLPELRAVAQLIESIYYDRAAEPSMIDDPGDKGA